MWNDPKSIHRYKCISFQNRETIKPKILWVRAFHKIYNPKMEILVLKSIMHDYPDAQLCMVGPDKDNSIDLIKDLIKKFGLEKNVIITGILTKKDWIKFEGSNICWWFRHENI